MRTEYMIILHNMRDIKRIFVHCTASNQATTTEETLRKEFKNKGWKNPGYHYVIKPNGNIIFMLPEEEVSNGVKGYNSTSINIAYIGGIDSTHPNGIDNRTLDQKATMFDLLVKLKQKYPKAIIMGHRDISPDTNGNGIVDPWERIKACPCFNAMDEYKDINNL